MLLKGQHSYAPVLRLKAGEYLALGELGSDVADRLLPYFIIPPFGEPDPEKGRPLTPQEIVNEPGRRVGKHWPRRSCLLDARFLLDVLEPSEVRSSLVGLFRAAHQANAAPTPVAALSYVLGEDGTTVYSDVLQKFGPSIALRIEMTELGDPSRLTDLLYAATSRLSIRPQDCILVLDLSEADFANPKNVGEFLESTLFEIVGMGEWAGVVSQGTSYPEVNPASPNSLKVLPRTDWLAWRQAAGALEFKSEILFGDFGADCSRFAFGKGRAAIPHLRYSTPVQWLISRGEKKHADSTALSHVATRIVDSGSFSGPEFSWGDEYIYSLAQGKEGPGNPMVWRKANTVHHITQVIGDLGAIYGYTVMSRRRAIASLQTTLF